MATKDTFFPGEVDIDSNWSSILLPSTDPISFIQVWPRENEDETKHSLDRLELVAEHLRAILPKLTAGYAGKIVLVELKKTGPSPSPDSKYNPWCVFCLVC